MPPGSRSGLTQIQRMQGFLWGDGARNDYGVWLDGGVLYSEAYFAQKSALVYDVRAYGAKGDAATNDTAAFAAALAAISARAGGGQALAELYIPPGWYVVDGGFTVPGGTTVRGAGVGVTTLLKNSGTSTLFTTPAGAGPSSNAANITFRDFAVDTVGGVTHTTGSVIQIQGSDAAAGGIGIYISRVQIADCYRGINLNGTQVRQVYVTDCVIENMQEIGIAILSALGSIHVLNASILSCTVGVEAINVGGGSGLSGILLANVDTNLCGRGLYLVPGVGQTVAEVGVVNCHFSGSTVVGVDMVAGSGSIHGVSFVGVHSNNCTGTVGFQNDGATGVSYDGCEALNNQTHGLALTANAVDVAITGGVYAGNGQALANTSHGIYVAPGTNHFRIRGVRSGQISSTANQQAYGIFVDTGASTNYIVAENDCTLNGTGGVQDLGTGTTKIVRDNLGSPSQAPATNLLVNPGFEIDQRGGTVTANNAYAHDRWQLLLGAASTASITDETTVVDVASGHAMKVVYTHSAVTFVDQKLEDYLQCRGQTLTFSIRVRKGAASSVRPYIADSGAKTFGVKTTTTGAYETLSVSLAIAAGATGVNVGVELSVSDTVYLDDAVLAFGGVPVAYAPLPPADDLARCLRYYVVIGGVATTTVVIAGQCNSSTAAFFYLRWPVTMAVAPSVTVNNPTNWRLTNSAAATVSLTALSASAPTQQSVELDATVASGLTAGNATTLFTGNSNATITAEANP